MQGESEKDMKEKKIKLLYELLEKSEKEHDVEVTAALRWAIFTLEQDGRITPTALFLHSLDDRAESCFLKFVCQIYFNIAFTLFCTSL